MRKRFFWLAALMTTMTVLVFSMNVALASGTPTIQSDKPDYAPGELVTLTGSNWQPGETVNIDVNDDQGQTWRRTVDVTAGAAGNITDTFNLPSWFVAEYRVVAAGAASGTATSTFTDSNPQAILVAAPTSATVAQGATAAYGSLTLQTGGNSNPCDTTFSVVAGGGTGLPAGATPQWGTNPVTTTGSDATTSFSVATTGSAPTGTYTFRIAGTNSTPPGGQCQGPGPTNSNLLTLTINAGTVNTTTAASSATATYGDASVTLNSTVTPASGPAVNAGTVTFTVKNGATTIGTATSGTVSGGTADASFSLSGVDAGTYTIEAAYSGGTGFNASNNSAQSPVPTLTVAQKQVTGSFTAANKVYDGNTSAAITSRSLAGVESGDDVSLSGGTATFGNKNVGTGKTVTGTGFSLSGADAGNYSLASSTLSTTANITPRNLTVTATGVDKVYDGTTAATVTLSTDKVSGDAVTAAYTSASFADKHVGTGKAVSVSGISISGADAGNYNLLNTTASTTANITARPITVTAVTDSKTYDGTTASSGTPTITSGSLADGDSATWTQSFDNRNAGTGKRLTPAGTVNDGNGGNNYAVTYQAVHTGEITPLGITGSFTAANKVYDGNTAATVLTRSLAGAISGDDVSLSGGTATFDNANVGAGKTVTLSGATLAGSDAGNYTLSSVGTTTASILAWNAQGSGFYQPVGVPNSVFVAAPGTPPASSSSTIWNTAKGGSTIPLKFNVFAGTVEKTSTSDISAFTAVKLSACSAGASMEDVEFVTTGSTTLRYDLTDGQFVQNWQTPRVNGETCYRATVTFADGSSLSAFFRLRK